MGQEIRSKLDELLFGTVDTLKIIYFNNKSQEIMKFGMFGDEIVEEDDVIRIIDNTEKQNLTPKTVTFYPSTVAFVTYEDDKTEDSILHTRKVIVRMDDQSRIELSVAAIG